MRERIKQLRKELGLSQAEFGKKLGISDAAVSKIESGVNSPSESTIKLICQSFGVRLEWLTAGQGDPFNNDSEARIERLIEQYAPDASPWFKAQVKAYGSLMTDEDWRIFRDIVDRIQQERHR